MKADLVTPENYNHAEKCWTYRARVIDWYVR